MRGLGMVALTGVAAIVVWRVFLGAFVGLFGLALKVALVFGVVYFLIQIFQKKEKKEDSAEA